MMTLTQTKLVGLTMRLNLKAKEFNILCDKLEEIKAKGIDQNDKRLLEIKKMFEQNHNEIVEINQQIRKLKEENVNTNIIKENVFDKKMKQENAKQGMSMIEYKESIFSKIINKIKSFFNR